MALTPAEKIRSYRERKKAKGLKQVNRWLRTGEPSEDASEVPENTDSRRAKWEAELRKEQLAEARKEGRRLARLQDTSRADGRVEALCDVAVYFIGKHRTDIAQFVLEHFIITRDKAAAVLEADKRTKSMTLSALDRAGAWEKPPMILDR